MKRKRFFHKKTAKISIYGVAEIGKSIYNTPVREKNKGD